MRNAKQWEIWERRERKSSRNESLLTVRFMLEIQVWIKTREINSRCGKFLAFQFEVKHVVNAYRRKNERNFCYFERLIVSLSHVWVEHENVWSLQSTRIRNVKGNLILHREKTKASTSHTSSLVFWKTQTSKWKCDWKSYCCVLSTSELFSLNLSPLPPSIFIIIYLRSPSFGLLFVY